MGASMLLPYTYAIDFLAVGRWLLVGLAEVEADVEFFFEEFSAAVGVDEVFGGVAVSGDAKADGAALE